MNRRRLFARVSALVLPSLAGCFGGETPLESGERTTEPTSATSTSTPSASASASPNPGTVDLSPSRTVSDSRSGTDTDTGTGVDTDTESSGSSTPGTEPAAPTGTTTTAGSGGSDAIVNRRIEIRDRACGTATDEGTVTFGDRRVVVAGTITGSDSCATAVLDEVTYDPGADRLRVVVTTEHEGDGGKVCSQCLTEIDYEASVTVANTTPTTVVLVHRGATGETRVTTATG